MLITTPKMELRRKLGSLVDENSSVYHELIRMAFTGVRKRFDGATYSIENDLDGSMYFVQTSGATTVDNKISRNASGALAVTSLTGTPPDMVGTSWTMNISALVAITTSAVAAENSTRFAMGHSVGTSGDSLGIGVNPIHTYVGNDANESVLGVATDDDANPFVAADDKNLIMALHYSGDSGKFYYFCHNLTDAADHYSEISGAVQSGWAVGAAPFGINTTQWAIPKCKVFHGAVVFEHTAGAGNELTDFAKWKADMLTMGTSLITSNGTV